MGRVDATGPSAVLLAGADVAIVGNASSLRGRQLGPVIDGADVVIRMNLGWPPVPGEMPLRGRQSQRETYDPCDRGMRMDVWVGSHQTVRVLPQAWHERVRQLWIKGPVADYTPPPKGIMVPVDPPAAVMPACPSTGFVMVFHVVELGVAHSVRLYGFDGFATSSEFSGDDGLGHPGADELAWYRSRPELVLV